MVQIDDPPGKDPRLVALERALRVAKGVKEAPGRASDGGMGQGLRMGVELVVAILVGAWIGWMLDRWLGTGPWLLLLMFMLGTAAGFRNLLRVAQRMQMQEEEAVAPSSDETGDRK